MRAYFSMIFLFKINAYELSIRNDNYQFITSHEIVKSKYKFNQVIIIRNMILTYFPFVIFTTLYNNPFYVFALNFLQFYLATNYFNIITIFVHYMVTTYTSKTCLYVFNIYLIMIFLFVVYHAYALIPLHEGSLRVMGLIVSFLMYLALLSTSHNLSLKQHIWVGAFIIYTIVLAPLSLNLTARKLEKSNHEDYKFYNYIC